MKRKLYQTLLDQKDSQKISILIGPRQVGKTTLLRQLHEQLGGIFIDFDILEHVERFETYTKCINSLILAGYDPNKKFYLFIDEFQTYIDSTKILKNIYDHHPNIKIYATGSSSITIKNNIQESLAGRKIIHHLYPLDFEEFLLFKNKDITRLTRIQNFTGDLPTQEYKEELEEFMQYGAYPEVVLSSHKQEILASIFDTFIKKDLVDYLNIKEILGVKKLIQYLAINNGQKLNISDMCQQLNLSRQKIENYFEVLEQTYILKKVTPFFTNKNKEITKAYKQYFIDPGVRNYFCNNFNPMHLRNDTGFLFETFVLGELLKHATYDIKFWQNKQQQEIDFIIDKVYEHIAVEVKYKQTLKAQDYTSIQHIKQHMNKYHIVNLIKQDVHHVLPTNIKKILT
ncbi:MAG: ATP-binding protein [Candidatus Woesearchaeota archaeon]